MLRLLSGRTCLKFVPRTNETDFISYFKGTSCWSYIGRRGGSQNISLDTMCLKEATIAHETIHALGFWHEHSRSDRDKFITIHWDNVKESNRGDFKKRTTTESQLFRDFDFKSTMLFGPTVFTSNGEMTMSSKIPGRPILRQRYKQMFSDGDVSAINSLYGC